MFLAQEHITLYTSSSSLFPKSFKYLTFYFVDVSCNVLVVIAINFSTSTFSTSLFTLISICYSLKYLSHKYSILLAKLYAIKGGTAFPITLYACDGLIKNFFRGSFDLTTNSKSGGKD